MKAIRGRKRYQMGVTLGELLVVLAVAAMLITSGVPALGGLMAAQRTHAANNLLVADLHFARTQAISTYQRVSMCPSTGGLSCTAGSRWEDGWMVFNDPGDNGQPASADEILRVMDAQPSIQITSTRPRIRFLPDGQARGTNLTLTVCDPARPERARAIIVSNIGRVRGERRPAQSC